MAQSEKTATSDHPDTRRDGLINQTRQHIAGAPPSDPDLIQTDAGKEGAYGDVYRHYG
jgi:hypothetical protein